MLSLLKTQSGRFRRDSFQMDARRVAELRLGAVRDPMFKTSEDSDGTVTDTQLPFAMADHRQNSSELNSAPTPATIHRMLELLIVVVRAFTLALRGHRELVLENLALRQQLAAFRRTTRCRLRARDRLLWMALTRSWTAEWTAQQVIAAFSR